MPLTKNFRFRRYYVIYIFEFEYLYYLLSDWDRTCFGKSRITMLRVLFYVTSGLANMTSLCFHLRISLLLYVWMSQNLVREIRIVHVTSRSYKISGDLDGHHDLWGQFQGKCIFFLYRFISYYITQFSDESLPIFNDCLWKKELQVA